MPEGDELPPPRRACGTMEVHERLLRTVPGYLEARSASEEHAWRANLAFWVGRTGCTLIPVVVHVVYKTAAQNISDAQIQSQIDVLNADFRRQNADVGSVPAPFAPLVGDARIQFELAKTDPSGAATNGITRTKTNVDTFSSGDDGIKAAGTGGADAWPADRYLNIWTAPAIVSPSGQSLLGYAQFPGGPAATDGVVILHSAFGTTGTAAAPFNLGRTTTHEVGHWLNLRHIWGDDGTACFGDDFVADTPNQGGPNYGTPTFPTISCSNGPNGDMFMNYMDYVDDAAMFMFTGGQVTRMQATLDGLRSRIGAPVPCAKAPAKDAVKDGPKDFGPKELQKEPPKEGIKDPPKDLPKDFGPKELQKEPPKDPPKESPKDLGKDLQKDPPKDLPKDGPKDFGPKELQKEPPKDGVKDLPKDPGLDPKGPFDPPKGVMEPPVDFPTVPGGPFGGGLPFVLATPAAPGFAQQAALRQQTATLAAGYLRLMAHYAQLHARGMLDAAGLAAWQEAAAAYQRLVAGAGSGGWA